MRADGAGGGTVEDVGGRASEGAGAFVVDPIRPGEECVRRGVGGDATRDLKDQPDVRDGDAGSGWQLGAAAAVAGGGGSSEVGVEGTERVDARASKCRER